MKIRALIVDDEPLPRRRSRALLRGESDVEVVGDCGDVPNLSVRMFLNVARGDDDRDSNEGIVRSFYLSFKTKHWPWEKYPKVFYDPRSKGTGNYVFEKSVIACEMHRRGPHEVLRQFSQLYTGWLL